MKHPGKSIEPKHNRIVDLAFVLLIIFVITSFLLEQSINLKLPNGGKSDRQSDPHDRRTVEITQKGAYYFDKRPMSLDQVESELKKAYRGNPNL